MGEIVLSNGLTALVDDEDLGPLSAFNWFAHKRHGRYYASRNITVSCNKQRAIHMHRLIAGAKPGQDVDHINGNGLDNRKENLRLATRTENNRNRRKWGAKSKFKGVQKRSPNSWRARIQVDGKRLHLGFYTTELRAALAYNNAAIKHFGKFANLNKGIENA